MSDDEFGKLSKSEQEKHMKKSVGLDDE